MGKNNIWGRKEPGKDVSAISVKLLVTVLASPSSQSAS